MVSNEDRTIYSKKLKYSGNRNKKDEVGGRKRKTSGKGAVWGVRG